MASDYLLEIDGIKGESRDDKHKDTLEIESFSLGATTRVLPRRRRRRGGQGQLPGHPLHDAREQGQSASHARPVRPGSTSRRRCCSFGKQGGDQQEYYKA